MVEPTLSHEQASAVQLLRLCSSALSRSLLVSVSLPGIRSSDAGVRHIVVLFAGAVLRVFLRQRILVNVVSDLMMFCQGSASSYYRISNHSRRLSGFKIAGDVLKIRVFIKAFSIMFL